MVCRLQSETKRWRKSRCNATWKFAGNNQLWKPRRITYACSEYCYSRGKIIWPEVCSMRESTGEAAAWPTEYFLAQEGGFGKEVGLVEGLELNCLCLFTFLFFSFTFFVAFPFPDWCLCPLQGLIFLQGNQVNELPPNPDEPGKHLFEIVPGRPLFPCTFSVTFFFLSVWIGILAWSVVLSPKLMWFSGCYKRSQQSWNRQHWTYGKGVWSIWMQFL